MQRFFDPGHGFMSSIDELAVMLTAVVLLAPPAFAGYSGVCNWLLIRSHAVVQSSE